MAMHCKYIHVAVNTYIALKMCSMFLIGFTDLGLKSRMY